MNTVSATALGLGLIAIGTAAGIAVDRAVLSPSPEITTTAGVEKVVATYLEKNPEVVIDAIRAFQVQQAEREQAAQAEQLVAQRDRLLGDETSPVAGNPDADVTIVEFFDYNCPYCKQASKTISALLEQDSNVRVVFKEFPILRPDSIVAARAALAAWRQDRDAYLDYHERLMDASGPYTEERLVNIARDVGLDVERLKQDMDDPELTDAIRRTQELAHTLGIRGTPAFVIGEQLIPGAVDLETLKEAVAEARAGTTAAGG